MMNYLFKIINKYFLYYNRIKFRINNINVGENLHVMNSIYIRKSPSATISIGNNFRFYSGSGFNPLARNIKGELCAEDGAYIKIGNNVGISSSCIWAHEAITIGNNVNIGGDCILLDSDGHSLNYIDRRFPSKDMENKKNSPIQIDDDVLIGTRSIILKGVHIGARTIIGSGSIVTKDIPADCIAAGNPCKILKFK
ncbi:acyltransferase [Phocaeicola coprocola]|uniref:acyltransferase n=1 Tax=Phocaeicola coprocola TaxID=310298 RepID=UPI0022E590D6|nr:acyltransferase [Phocaeicola coprocola]